MIPLRDENPSETLPYVTWGLIAANVGVFLLQAAVHVTRGFQASAYLVATAGAIPVEITRLTDYGPPDLVPVPLTVLSSMFLHGGLMHLLGNMLFLWVFGDNVEDFMGHARYAAFYFGTGVVAAMAHIVSDPTSDIPVVGASGAISGVLGAYIVLYPRARVVTLVPIVVFIQIVKIPAMMFLGIWFLMQVVSAPMNAAMGAGGVAFLAHIGGFVAGALTVPLFERQRRRRRIDAYWE